MGPFGQARSSVSGSPLEMFSVRGDGAVLISMNAASQDSFVASATVSAGYTGTVVRAKTSNVAAGDGFYLFKVPPPPITTTTLRLS